MAVEARHRNLFRPTNPDNRQLMMNGVEGNGSVFGAQMEYGVPDPLSGIKTATDNAVHRYSSTPMNTLLSNSAAMKSDNPCPAYALPLSRKRSRDTIEFDPALLRSFPNVAQNQSENAINRCSPFTFLGEDISSRIQQQQMEIDRFISQHTEKLRIEMEERRRKYSRRIAAAVEEQVMKKLKEKEVEIEKIGKLNLALEERVKSLSIENQIWRDLAQTNEAKANALRCDFEQAIAQVHEEQLHHYRAAEEAALMDDVQSCCGSNFEEIESPPVLPDNGTAGDLFLQQRRSSDRGCRSCGKEESCVLLLPCRHLCLCSACGSSLHTCPVCNSVKTATLHLNLSSSL